MAADDRELFLIDGNSLVYRAFFALPETIATSTGQPTNAIFGFASMLVKILTEYGSQPTLVCWDAGMSGREEVSTEYKAGRRERPDLLSEQWPHMHPLVEAFGYENVRVEGYEADDVIATLARQAREKDIDVMVVTGDRDMFQIVGDGVRVMATSRGITETKIYDREAVIERYGIPPESIPDFYGLKGDTSDNIPGVPGIGDKTASDLLQRFGDLETVLASIDEISGAKRKENLTNHADDARLSKELATIQLDVPVDIDLEELHGGRAGPLGDPRDLPRVRAARPAAAARGGARARTKRALRAASAKAVEARAVKVAPAGLSQLDGELAALAADRPQPDEPAQGELIPAEPEPLRFAAYAGGGRAGGRGRDARGGDDGVGRPPARRARLEVDRGARGAVPDAAARARHARRRLPAGSRRARLPVGRAARERGHRRLGEGGERPRRGRGGHARARRAPARAARRAGADAASCARSSCRWSTS